MKVGSLVGAVIGPEVQEGGGGRGGLLNADGRLPPLVIDN